METTPEKKTDPYDWSIKGNDRALGILADKVAKMERALEAIKEDKLEEVLQLPQEEMEKLGLSSKPYRRLKCGRGSRPLLQSEIEEAKKHSKSESGAARYLGVSYQSYKKYAQMYGIFDPHPNIRGKKNIYNPELGKYPLHEILEGKHPKYPVFRLKDKLIRSGTKPAKCEICGYSERRPMDGKMPLILNFLDGDSTNHRLDNIQLLCYNCTFTCGKGYLRRGTRYFDPDYMQGAAQDEFLDSRY